MDAYSAEIIQFPKVFDPIQDLNRNLLNTIAYLRRLDKFPVEWQREQLKTDTREGICQGGTNT